MRLLITTDTVGGVWTFTRELTQELLSRGHAVSLVSFGGPANSSQQVWLDAQGSSHGENFQYKASSAPLEWMGANDRAFSEGEAGLHAAAAAFGPDLLLSNQFCFGASTLGVPRVVAAHSDVLSWARAAKPSALQATPWLDRYTALVQSGLLQAQAVVGPTRSVIKGLKDSFFLPTNGIVIANGLGLPAAPDEVRQLQAVLAGRLWDEAKGVAVLAGLDLPMPLLLAGSTHHEDQSLPPELSQQPNLTLVGELPPKDLHQLYRQSALYLCPSLYEPFGLAPLEAALAGCALLCRDLPSLREVWADNAFYFSEAKGLQAQLERLANNPGLLADAGSRAQAHAQQYTPKRMADAYLQVFHSVLAGRGDAAYVA